MSKSTQQYCLFPENDSEVQLALEASPQGPEYFALPDLERLAVNEGQLMRTNNGAAAILLETIRNKTGAKLLMATDTDLRVTVNGLQANRINILKTGDVVGIDEHVLHVSLLNRPYSGPPAEDQLGVPCGYCRLPIADDANMRIYVCPTCRQPTHDHGEDVPGEDRLECTKMSGRCGHCDAEIVHSEGLTHVPEL
ncbi:MAG: hypothetical protein WBF93_05690 [Pirellulales bacterium]